MTTDSKTTKQQAAWGRRERRISQLEHRCGLLMLAMGTAGLFDPCATEFDNALDVLDFAVSYFERLSISTIQSEVDALENAIARIQNE